jgi:hypothetical protein
VAIGNSRDNKPDQLSLSWRYRSCSHPNRSGRSFLLNRSSLSLCHSRRVSESLGFQRSVKPSFAHGSAADYVEEAMIVNQLGICSIFGEVV